MDQHHQRRRQTPLAAEAVFCFAVGAVAAGARVAAARAVIGSSIGASLQAIFLTHTHRDHVAAVPALRAAFSNTTLYGPKREPFAGAYAVSDGDCFDVGSLQIKARLTNGHSKGGTSYLMDGLTKKIACVGDALFACSQGGMPAAQYAKSIEINRSKLLSLPGDTVLCPGHGPLTTVAHENSWNPFYAGLK